MKIRHTKNVSKLRQYIILILCAVKITIVKWRCGVDFILEIVVEIGAKIILTRNKSKENNQKVSKDTANRLGLHQKRLNH